MIGLDIRVDSGVRQVNPQYLAVFVGAEYYNTSPFICSAVFSTIIAIIKGC